MRWLNLSGQYRANLFAAFAGIVVVVGWSQATHASGGPGVFDADFLLPLATLYLVGLIGGAVFEWFGMPAVAGELIGGILVGNLALFGLSGISTFSGLSGAEPLKLLAELGVILLLFQTGLSATFREMAAVGWQSLVVAVAGVAAPFVLGFGIGAILEPAASVYQHLFVGSVLTATSVGITARVIADLGAAHLTESKIILGAAVIDDILGLLVLAVMTGLVTSASTTTGQLGTTMLAISVKALLFLGGAVIAGVFLMPRVMRAIAASRHPQAIFLFSLVLCFALAWISWAIGLATIVGAFAAGLMLEEPSHTATKADDSGVATSPPLSTQVSPVVAFLAPLFFVRMGMLVDLHVFASWPVIGMTLLLTLVAILGKLACALVIWTPGVNRWTVGVGMIPRGEVGLIFAGIGATLSIDSAPLVPAALFAAIVGMVMLTTLLTPVLLGRTLGSRLT